MAANLPKQTAVEVPCAKKLGTASETAKKPTTAVAAKNAEINQANAAKLWAKRVVTANLTEITSRKRSHHV